VSHKHSCFSWWWAHSHSKYVGKRNKHTKKTCAPSWLYLQDYHHSLLNNPEERSYHQLRDGSLKSRILTRVYKSCRVWNWDLVKANIQEHSCHVLFIVVYSRYLAFQLIGLPKLANPLVLSSHPSEVCCTSRKKNCHSCLVENIWAV
jgi:hypothetical protein